jgi:hypothetical protein
MDLICPQCTQELPQVETLKYRFCPHCGAEIDAAPRPLGEAFLTTPPKSPLPPEGAESPDPGPDHERGTAVAGQFEDQTIAPQPITPENRPPIRPPAEPPPPGFFRTSPSEPEPPPPIPQKQRAEKVPAPSPPPPEKPAAKNHQKVFIAVLIILALVILILGGLFTF